MRTDSTAAKKTERQEAPPQPEIPTERRQVSVQAIVPDPQNRVIDESGEEFASLLDSVRVFGVLQPPHVKTLSDSKYFLLDGERRWRAAKKLGFESIACDVWPEQATARDAIAANRRGHHHEQ
jgi:ParB family chromosome partitioning protein